MPDGPGGFAQDFSCPALLRMPLGRCALRVRNCHPLRLSFPGHSPRATRATTRSYYPRPASPQGGFGLFPGRSPLLGESLICFLLLQVLRCFSSLRSPPYVNVGMTGLQPDGLSHSEIRGSQAICAYPRLIAAYHVLHRLREPRHPPDALTLLSPFMQTGCRGPRVLFHPTACHRQTALLILSAVT